MELLTINLCIYQVSLIVMWEYEQPVKMAVNIVYTNNGVNIKEGVWLLRACQSGKYQHVIYPFISLN